LSDSSHDYIALKKDRDKIWFLCYTEKVIKEILMFSTELSELIDEIREIEIYNQNPQDWMNYLESDDCLVPDEELVY